jgi:RHS repeat-associated protein
MGMSVVGNSTFKVLVDGDEVYNSDEMTPGMTDTILLNVSGMDLLELITENNGDYMYDHTDWADARLIKYAKKEVGVYYLRARYYQPTTGRFMSEDSIRSGLNYYTYTMNNPLFFIDPLGLAEVGLRAYAESYGATVSWDDKTRLATITYGGISKNYSVSAYKNVNGRIIIDDSILNETFGWGKDSEARTSISNNAQNIINAANKFGVDQNVVAGVIYAERNTNLNFIDKFTDLLSNIGVDTSVGLGQVRLRTAEMLEQSGYMPLTPSVTYVTADMFRYNIATTYNIALSRRLEDDKINSLYVAAYIKFIQDKWQGEFPAIADRPDILGTLYNLGVKTPHGNPEPNDFGSYVQEHYGLMSYLLGVGRK